MRHILIALLSTTIFGGIWFADRYPDQTGYIIRTVIDGGVQLAAAIAHKPKTVAGLKSAYDRAEQNQEKIRILIVPGHEPDYGGTEFKKIIERDLNVVLADHLLGFMGQNKKYQVFTTRTKEGWSPEFSDYFKNQWDGIVSWRAAIREQKTTMIAAGTHSRMEPAIKHNDIPRNVALRLHGINKWANENDIDIVIHIHFNDYPGHPKNIAGKHSGFAIYIPENQYQNSTSTRAVAEAIFRRLEEHTPVSTLSGESNGIIEDPDLIAIGADDSANAASMLIEYGYIYEPQFADPVDRDPVLKDLAFQTYLGIKDFFDPSANARLYNDTSISPYIWSKPIQ